MYGANGTVRRRRVILAEFLLGTVTLLAFGAGLLIQASGWAGRGFGLWMVGAGLNYAPLALFALELSRAGVLEDELAGVDTGEELRRYSILQFWVLVPFAVVALATRDVLARRS